MSDKYLHFWPNNHQTWFLALGSSYRMLFLLIPLLLSESRRAVAGFPEKEKWTWISTSYWQEFWSFQSLQAKSFHTFHTDQTRLETEALHGWTNRDRKNPHWSLVVGSYRQNKPPDVPIRQASLHELPRPPGVKLIRNSCLIVLGSSFAE